MKKFPHTDHNKTWATDFLEENGRPPKILHIGNIANNAYLNAKYLNKAGYECDVLCYDYYHIMACPEWEELDFNFGISDPNNPPWFDLVKSDYSRPRWFAQGSLSTSIDYLTAKQEGREHEAQNLWQKLCIENRTIRDEDYLTKQSANTNSNFFQKLKRLCNDKFLTFIRASIFRKMRTSTFELSLSAPAQEWVNYWIDNYSKIKSNDKDELRPLDIIGFYDSLPRLRRLFNNYDIIHGYATDGILSLLSNKTYLAYEHGTIRSTPFCDSSAGRICRLTYCFANGVAITNADNIVAAKKLKLKNYKFIPHPINEDAFNNFSLTEKRSHRELYQKKMGAEFIVFHPARHHWGGADRANWDKGNDVFIRGFANFVHEAKVEAKAIFVEWGQNVKESKLLISRLKIEKNIIWIPPISAKEMAKMIESVDLLADQFYLGAFGSTLPRALACGTPSMIYLDEHLHHWCFDEMPPVINACNEKEVFEGLLKAHFDKLWADENFNTSKEWYAKYHSSKVIIEKLSTAYREALMVDNGL
jgi:hypothetical protein